MSSHNDKFNIIPFQETKITILLNHSSQFKIVFVPDFPAFLTFKLTHLKFFWVTSLVVKLMLSSRLYN